MNGYNETAFREYIHATQVRVQGREMTFACEPVNDEPSHRRVVGAHVHLGKEECVEAMDMLSFGAQGVVPVPKKLLRTRSLRRRGALTSGRTPELRL